MLEKVGVSVLTITYGHEAYIAATIEGVLNQEVDFPVEMIIADDCSPDNTEDVIKGYIETHPKGHWIKYTKHKENKGMNMNFIWAMEQCQGNYVALCEGDDYWIDPLKLKKQVDFLEENKSYSMCFTNQEVVSEKGEIISRSKYEEKDYTLKEIVAGFIPGTQTNMFRNYEGLSSMMRRFISTPSGDRMLAYCCSFFGDIKVLPEYTAAYRQTGSGVWNKYDAEEKFFVSLEGFINFHQTIGFPVNNELIYKRINGAYFYWLKKDVKHLNKIIKRILAIKRKYGIRASFFTYLISRIRKS